MRAVNSQKASCAQGGAGVWAWDAAPEGGGRAHLLLHVGEKQARDESHALAVADVRVVGGVGAEDVEERALEAGVTMGGGASGGDEAPPTHLTRAAEVGEELVLWESAANVA